MKVPSYGSPKVQSSTTRNIGTMNAPIEQFGGGKANALGDVLSTIGETGFKIAHQARENADNLAAKKFQNELDAFHVNQYRAGDPEKGVPSGAFASKGSEAFLSAPDRLQEEFNKKKNDLLSQAANDRQRAMIESSAQTSWEQMSKTMLVHSQNQKIEFDKEQTANSILLNKNLAIHNYKDEAAVNQAHIKQATAITTFGKSSGMAPAEIEQMIRKNISATNTDIVSRYVTNKNIDGGKAFYEKNKDLFHGEDLIKVEGMFKEGSSTKIAETESTKIVEEFNDTYAAINAARERIKDPDALEKAESRIRIKMKEKNEAPIQVYDNRLMTAVESVDKTGDVSDSVMSGLLPEGKRAIQKYIEHSKGIITIEPDNQAYFKFSSMSMAEMGRIPQTDIVLKYKTSTTPEQFKSIAEKWQLARDGLNGDQGAKSKWNSTGEDNSFMMTALKDVGVFNDNDRMNNLDSKKRKIFINYQEAVTSEIDRAMHNNGGKPIADEERRKIFNDTLKKTVRFGSFIFEKNVPLITIDKNDESSLMKVKLDNNDKSQILSMAKKNKIIPMTMSDADAEIKLGKAMRKAKLFAIQNGGLDTDLKKQKVIDILRGNE